MIEDIFSKYLEFSIWYKTMVIYSWYMCFHVPGPSFYQMVNKLCATFICAIFVNNLVYLYEICIVLLEFREEWDR